MGGRGRLWGVRFRRDDRSNNKGTGKSGVSGPAESGLPGSVEAG